MDIRMIGVTLVVPALLLAGCGKDSTPAATPTSAAAPTSTAAAPPPMSDEDQIRDVLTKEGAAMSAWNFDQVAEFTCAEYRDQAKLMDSAIPPMSTFPAADAASMGPQAFADQLGTQFTGASGQALRAVADAVIGQDEAAYKAAMLDVVKQSMSVQLVSVDNIVVTGDTATADATVTQTMGTQRPETRTSPANLVREDGQWKDCTPPAQQ
jgi:hypothetical protein